MSIRPRAAPIAAAMVLAVGLAWAPPPAHASASRSCLTSAARNLLSRIEAQFGTMQVISTCRRGARIRNTGKVSRHASGNAVDFNAGSRKGAVIGWLLANHHSGGTMTYRGSPHIHVDIGYRFVSLAGSRARVASAGSRRSSSRAALRRSDQSAAAVALSDVHKLIQRD
jgi:hypothetical protein